MPAVTPAGSIFLFHQDTYASSAGFLGSTPQDHPDIKIGIVISGKGKRGAGTPEVPV